MVEMRNIIETDEAKCNGCGECILSCAEGAIEIVDGKARLKGEIYCDGLGACIGSCPEDALTVIKRAAESFDEHVVKKMLEREKDSRGCAGSEIKNSVFPMRGNKIGLNNWPVKLKLIKPEASFLKDSDFNLVADCVGVSFPDLYKELHGNKIIAIGCPKLDNLDEHIDKLSKITKISKPNSISVFCMEVPCCKGFVYAIDKAIESSNFKMKQPPCYNIVSTKGEIIKREKI